MGRWGRRRTGDEPRLGGRWGPCAGTPSVGHRRAGHETGPWDRRRTGDGARIGGRSGPRAGTPRVRQRRAGLGTGPWGRWETGGGTEPWGHLGRRGGLRLWGRWGVVHRRWGRRRGWARGGRGGVVHGRWGGRGGCAGGVGSGWGGLLRGTGPGLVWSCLVTHVGKDFLGGGHGGGALEARRDDGAGDVREADHLLQRPAGQQPVAQRPAEAVSGA